MYHKNAFQSFILVHKTTSMTESEKDNRRRAESNQNNPRPAPREEVQSDLHNAWTLVSNDIMYTYTDGCGVFIMHPAILPLSSTTY